MGGALCSGLSLAEQSKLLSIGSSVPGYFEDTDEFIGAFLVSSKLPRLSMKKMDKFGKHGRYGFVRTRFPRPQIILQPVLSSGHTDVCRYGLR